MESIHHSPNKLISQPPDALSGILTAECNEAMNTFKFGLQEFTHTIGDENCKGCRWDTPQPCECGGLVHIEATPLQPYVFKFRCDRCIGMVHKWKRKKRGPS